MTRRASISVEVPGLALFYDGDEWLFEVEVRPMLDGVVRGTWRREGPLPQAPEGPAGPPDADAAPTAVAERTPAPSPAAAPAPAPARAPDAAPAARPGPGAPSIDFRPLLSALAKEKGRRAEREAVLAALAGMAAEGTRDATAAEVVAWLEKRGFPARELKPRPILAKLCHRKGLAVPGLMKNTYRATPARCGRRRRAR